MTLSAPGLGPGRQLRPTPTWAGPRPVDCLVQLPARARMAKMKGCSLHADLLPHQVCPCLRDVQRKRSRSSGCAVSFQRAGRGHSHGALRGGEKGLLCALELSRHWSPCPEPQRGRPLARWRAAGERDSWAEPSASPPPQPHPHPLLQASLRGRLSLAEAWRCSPLRPGPQATDGRQPRRLRSLPEAWVLQEPLGLGRQRWARFSLEGALWFEGNRPSLGPWGASSLVSRSASSPGQILIESVLCAGPCTGQ